MNTKKNYNLHELESQGYFNIRNIPGRGICGLFRFIFTVGLCYGINEHGYIRRYCYSNLVDAISALEKWDGDNDPGGNWIKHKGNFEYKNPNYETANA